MPGCAGTGGNLWSGLVKPKTLGPRCAPATLEDGAGLKGFFLWGTTSSFCRRPSCCKVRYLEL
eukprot:5881898-Amphidinium_carterae.1